MSFDQSKFQLRGDSSAGGAQSAQTKLQNEATEHTLAGCAIGAVRDLIPGMKGSAQSNDQIAHIAADTVASLPMVKTMVGGVIRASMLIDPYKGWESNATSFGLNFVEGAALNKVSKMAMPESGFSQLVTSKLGTGLGSEAVTHLTVGLGFGAVRTGFNADSWKDNQGNFSLASGAENLIKGSATGALVNLPAGMVGFRVARASSLALESSAFSPRMASVISGVGSGYAAGGVFGGLDAVMAGKSFVDVLKGVNEGGMIGAATGGFMGSFDGTRLLNTRVNGNGLTTHEATVTPSGAEVASKPGRPINSVEAEVPPQAAKRGRDASRDQVREMTGDRAKDAAQDRGDAVEPQTSKGRDKVFYPANDEHFVLADGQYEALTIKPFEIPRIEDIAHRLTRVEVKSEPYKVFDADTQGPWTNYDEYASRSLKTHEQDFRIYQVDGGKAEIALPEAYAKQLDAVRDLRIKAEQRSVLDDLPRGHDIAVMTMVKDNNANLFRSYFDAEQTSQVLPIIWARIKLAEHPLGTRALPEDFVSLLDEVPTTNNIKRLNIWDSPSPLDAWHGQEHGSTDFKAAATALESQGRIDFFKTNRTDRGSSSFRDILRGSFFHEHSHLVPPRDNTYDQASLLEKDGYYTTEYSKTDNGERWAEDRAKAFLHPDVDKFLEFAQEAPLRSVVIAHELRRQLDAAPQEQHSVYSQQMWERVKFVEDQVLPYARQELTWHLGSKNQDQQNAALRLLERFGKSDQAEPLMRAAAGSSDVDFRRRAFDTAVQLHSRDPVAQFDYVWEQGIANPSLRDLAVNRLRRYGTTDERASSYANLLNYIGNNDLTGLAKQVSRMQTDEGSQLAYDYAMNMGRNLKGYQRAVAISALEEVPSLRLRALATLANQPPEYIAPAVKKFVNDNDPEVAQAAREVLKGVELRTTIQEVNNVLDHGGTVKPRLLEALGASGDSDAIPSLLQIVTRGPESTRSLAVDELSRFDPNVVRYYTRLARKDLSVDQAKHLELVKNRK